MVFFYEKDEQFNPHLVIFKFCPYIIQCVQNTALLCHVDAGQTGKGDVRWTNEDCHMNDLLLICASVVVFREDHMQVLKNAIHLIQAVSDVIIV